MPEMVFAFFHQKFGSKAIVEEYIGSLNNTMLHYLKVSFLLAKAVLVIPLLLGRDA